jgi:hypothetical protein
MNSDKAAAVRDSINGCPDVVDPEDTSEYSTSRMTYSPVADADVTYTGEFLKPDRSCYRPAYVEQSGTIGDGEGATRPVYVVVLEPLWHQSDDVRLLSPELVYEIAKHDCRIRFYPPEHRLGGAIWVTDRFTEDLTNTDGERCECGSTYFKIRDGTPECAKCGAPTEQTDSAQLTLTAAQYAGGDADAE